MALSLKTRRKLSLQLSLLLAGCVALCIGGLYYLLLAFSPEFVPLPSTKQAMSSPAVSVGAANKVYIPKIGLDLPFFEGDANVLNRGVWHRYAERGDPIHGGNFILAGHRFSMGLTPAETVKQSPFYHLDSVKEGDKIYVDYNAVRYVYKVVQHFTVAPSQSEVEAESSTPKLTLYSCTLGGEADGREVIVATPDV